MEKPKFSTEIEDLLARAAEECVKLKNNDKQQNLLPLCEELLPHAISTQSEYLFALYYYYMAEYSSYIEDSRHTRYYTEKAIPFLQYIGEERKLGITYNLLGIYAENMGDTKLEVTCFLHSLEYSRKIGFTRLEAMSSMNLGLIYNRIGYHEEADHYYRQALAIYDSIDDWTLSHTNYCYLYLNMGNNYIACGNLAEAKKYYQHIQDYVEECYNEGVSYHQFLIHTFYANYFLLAGDLDEVDRQLEIANRDLPSVAEYHLYVDDITIYLNVLMKAKHYDDLLFALNFFIGRCKSDQSGYRTFTFFLSMKKELAAILKDDSLLIEASNELFEILKADKERETLSITDAIKSYEEDKALLEKQKDVLADNAALRQSIEEAISANKAKSTFISSMSHEIRTPINAVLGLDEMIIRESNEVNIRDYAYSIQSAGKSLLAIINDILDYSRIESGKMQVSKNDYEVNTLINDLLNLVEERVEKKSLKLNVALDPSMPKTLHGDELHLRQIINNILTNAVKYTEQGTITLSFGGERISSSRFMLTVHVKDTGIGIKPEEKNKLLQPFERLDEKRNRSIEGTGLGLSIVSRLLDALDSELKVDSVYGEGSDFYFTVEQLIASGESVGRLERKFAPTYRRTEAIFDGQGKKILAVDDQKINLMVVQKLLKRTKAEVYKAESGYECLSLCEKEKFDVILMDHRMPEMDGVETLKNLRASLNENINTPVIALTATVYSGVEDYFKNEGFTDFLSKPVNGDDLERMLAKYV